MNPIEVVELRQWVAILTDADLYATHVGELKARIAAATDGQAATVAEGEAFDTATSAAMATLGTEVDMWAQRQVDAIAKKRALEPRRARIRELYAAWRFIGENDELVSRGLKAPRWEPLTKAERAFRKPEPKPEPPAPEPPRPEHWGGPREPAIYNEPPQLSRTERSKRRRASRGDLQLAGKP